MAALRQGESHHFRGFLGRETAVGLAFGRNFRNCRFAEGFLVGSADLTGHGFIGFDEASRFGIVERHGVRAALEQQLKHGASVGQRALARTGSFVPLPAGRLGRIHRDMTSRRTSDAGLHTPNSSRESDSRQALRGWPAAPARSFSRRPQAGGRLRPRTARWGESLFLIKP